VRCCPKIRVVSLNPLLDSDSPERTRQVAKFVLVFLYNVDRSVLFSPHNAIPNNDGVVDLQKCVRQRIPQDV
jgi:hypothetical protein